MGIINHIRIIILTLLLSFNISFRFCISLPFHLFRWFISKTCKLWKPNLRKVISTNIFINNDATLPISHNLLISINVKGLLQLEHFKQQFIDKILNARYPENGTLLYPELQEEIVLWVGYPFWQSDQNFNINNHILLYKDDRNVSKPQDSSDEQFNFKIEQKILKEQFKIGEKSPWKFYIVLDPKNDCSHLLFCFHHSLCEGRSMYNALMKITDSSEVMIPPSLSMWLRLKYACRYIDLLFPTTLMKDFLKDKCEPPYYVPLESMSEDRHIVKSSKISRNKIKDIVSKQDVPFTAVLLCAITGAMRNYLVDLNLKIPDVINCPMPIPTAEQGRGFKNAPENISLFLPTGLDNIKERLQACKKTFLDSKNKSQFLLFVTINNIISNAYPLIWKPAFKNSVSAALSSFPGPVTPISICQLGHVITDMHFMYYGQNLTSLFFTTLTYDDGIRIILSADTSVFYSEKNIITFMKSLETEIENIHNISLLNIYTN